MKQYKIVVEKHPDGYVAYPLGIKGIVVGQGDTYEEALSDIKSAMSFHLDAFGPDALEVEPRGYQEKYNNNSAMRMSHEI